jgi:hypothetical protein
LVRGDDALTPVAHARIIGRCARGVSTRGFAPPRGAGTCLRRARTVSIAKVLGLQSISQVSSI